MKPVKCVSSANIYLFSFSGGNVLYGPQSSHTQTRQVKDRPYVPVHLMWSTRWTATFKTKLSILGQSRDRVIAPLEFLQTTFIFFLFFLPLTPSVLPCTRVSCVHAYVRVTHTSQACIAHDRNSRLFRFSYAKEEPYRTDAIANSILALFNCVVYGGTNEADKECSVLIRCTAMPLVQKGILQWISFSFLSSFFFFQTHCHSFMMPQQGWCLAIARRSNDCDFSLPFSFDWIELFSELFQRNRIQKFNNLNIPQTPLKPIEAFIKNSSRRP